MSRRAGQRTVAGPYGPVLVRYNRWPGVVAVLEGAGLPAVTVRGNGVIDVDGRRAAWDGRERWWDPRRKARATAVRFDGRRYELRPTGLFRGRLTRDGRPVAEARGGLRAYSPFHGFPGLDATLTWAPEVEPIDAAIGLALVVAFGPGAPGALTRIALFWLDWTN